MKKAKLILPIILPILLIMGILAVSGHAKKPPSPPGLSKPEPVLVSVMGAIEGIGDPYEISVKFLDTSFGDEAGWFVANPDSPPALKVTGPGKSRKRLRYYYCDHESHNPQEGGICNDTTHDPNNYKCLTIYGGSVLKKTDNVIFPAGSRWAISYKVTMGVIHEGTLDGEVTYDVLDWSTP